MPHRSRPVSSSRRRERRAGVAIAVAVAAIAASGMSGLALASLPATLQIAKQVKVAGKVENLVVNRGGVTVYTLSGETAGHLKCAKANGCFSAWFPVRASSRSRPTAARGIKGNLGTLSRDGFRQITLSGHPLYTFIGDANKKRRATGEGIISFRGTWHVVGTSSPQATTMPTPPPSTTTTTTSTATSSPYYP